jgi:hypothetical protein
MLSIIYYSNTYRNISGFPPEDLLDNVSLPQEEEPATRTTAFERPYYVQSHCFCTTFRHNI